MIKSFKQFLYNMHPMILSRFVIYIVAELILLSLTVILGFATRSLLVIGVFAFIDLGLLYFAYLFYRANKLGNVVIIVGICEERNEYRPGIIGAVQGATNKSKRLSEYRVLVQSENGSPSYIYLLLPEFNRMREGATYNMMFFRSETGEYSEKNLVTFQQIAQNVYAKGTNGVEIDGTGGDNL